MTFINLSSITNPDKLAIEKKSEINIGVSLFDITASLTGSPAYSAVQLNSSQQRMVLVSDAAAPEDEPPTTGIYYTPVYNERISYAEWTRTINKTFEELEVV
jgi:hypothetical protein